MVSVVQGSESDQVKRVVDLDPTCLYKVIPRILNKPVLRVPSRLDIPSKNRSIFYHMFL